MKQSQSLRNPSSAKRRHENSHVDADDGNVAEERVLVGSGDRLELRAQHHVVSKRFRDGREADDRTFLVCGL